jgi:hypothetical protein
MSTLRTINVIHPSGSTTNIVNDASGNVAVGNNLTVAGTSTISGNETVTGTLVMGSSFKRNRIINGNMVVDQRNSGAAQTITAAAALAYTVDRWYGYSTGANVTGQQVAGATANQYRYRFTGAASVTAIGFAQRIEAINSADLAGTTATLSVDLANSLLTTVTWTAYYANTTDTFGSLASPTVTSIATGTFTVTSTVTRYNAQISIPSAATTGLQIVFSVGAQTSGTWTIGSIQLEVGTKATPYEMQIYSDQLAQCQRYYYKLTPGASLPWLGAITQNGNAYASVSFPVEMRTAPTVGDSSPSKVTSSPSGNQIAVFQSGYQTISGTVTVTSPNTRMAQLFIGTIGGVSAGQGVTVDIGSGYYLTASAEL